MSTRKLTLLMPLLIAASAPFISEAATGDQAASASAQPSNESLPPSAPQNAVGLPAAPQDEGGLQTIIITAERRAVDVQKTAAAVSVRKGDDLLQQGKTTIRQILEDVPAVVVIENQGMYIAGSDTAGNNVSIRGINSNNTTAASNLPSVPTTALYVDGVYEGIGGNYDLDRVEVLRGPQGTLYGRSATSGVVASSTRNPTFDKTTSIDGTVELGSYDLQHYTGAVNVPVSDTFAVRIAADQFSRDGYDSAEGGRVERTSGRLKMLYKPNSDLSVLFGAALEQNTTHTGGMQANMTDPNTFVYNPVPIREGTNNFQQYWMNIDWNLGPAMLTYLPALRRWDQDAVIYQAGPGGGGLNQILKTPFDQFQTHELRLASMDKGPLAWLVGAFYYDNRLHNTNDIRWLSSNALLNESETRKDTSNKGVFGETTYAFVDTWRLTAGLRKDRTDVQTTSDTTNNLNYGCNTPLANVSPGCLPGPPNLPNAGLPENNVTLSLTGDAGAREFNNTTYKLRLEHDLSKSNLMYGMVSTGFIPGDVQVTAGAGGAPVASEYGAEQLTAFEIGSKNRFLNNRLQINADVFYYNYGGYRTSIRPDPTNPGSQILLTVPARVLGDEIELQYMLTPQDHLSLNYSDTRAHFTDAPVLFTENVADTHDVPGVIPHSFNAAYRHTLELPGDSSLDLRADARFQSAHLLDNITAQMGQEGLAYVHVDNQWTGNLSSTWTPSVGDYSVTAYVRNVTDNRYKTFTQVQLLQPVVIATGTQYEPRTFGIVLSARY